MDSSLLLHNGWFVGDTTNMNLSLSEDELYAVHYWETTFASAFSLSNDIKISSGAYRVEHGVSVGYRHDEEREFFESRLTSKGICEPNFTDYVTRYNNVVVHLYSACNKIAVAVLNSISDELGWDRRVLIDLTDITQNGILPEVPQKPVTSVKFKESVDDSSNVSHSIVESTLTEELSTRIQYSSSLLRICKYLHQNDSNNSCYNKKKQISFGSHTDSSFITIAPVSSSPGLELVDQLTNKWVCPEVVESSAVPAQGVRVIVFVGEFLQVLTKNRFKATVHRVIETKSTSSGMRISCPYLIRGRNDAIININDPKYSHAIDAITPEKVPDLDGTSMKLLHKLLDLKRQKCFRDNDSKPGNWVLSAYPIENMPEDEEQDSDE